MLPEHDGGRPGEERPLGVTAGDAHKSSAPKELLADLDAMAEQLRARYAIQVSLGPDRYRTNIYRSSAAAERAVKRATERGERAHVTLVQMLPIGVVVGMGGAA